MNHYKQRDKESIEIIKSSLLKEEFRGFLVGNVYKYLNRYRYKGSPREDLDKAIHYLQALRYILDHPDCANPFEELREQNKPPQLVERDTVYEWHDTSLFNQRDKIGRIMPDDDQVLLEVGDVVNIRAGLWVYVRVKGKLMFGDSATYDEYHDEIKLPKTYTYKDETLTFSNGEYVVVKTDWEGGGMNFDGPYPHGYCVYCRALKDGEYDPDGNMISFFQTGSYGCKIKNITPIKKIDVSSQ
jgi:hypothetical protein